MEQKYKQNIQQAEKDLFLLVKQNRITAIIRAVAFFSAIAICWVLWSKSMLYASLGGSSLLFIFMYFVQKSSQLKVKIKKQNALIQLNTDEIACINGSFEQFHKGKEFINYDHNYTSDLDVFGAGSIFQYLNRTCTLQGKIRLAENLTTIDKDILNIKNRQIAIKELAKKVDYRQHFQSEGMIYRKQTLVEETQIISPIKCKNGLNSHWNLSIKNGYLLCLK